MMDYGLFKKVLLKDISNIAAGEFRNVLAGSLKDDFGRDKIVLSVKYGRERAHISSTMDVLALYRKYGEKGYAEMLEGMRGDIVNAKYIPDTESMNRQQAQSA